MSSKQRKIELSYHKNIIFLDKKEKQRFRKKQRWLYFRYRLSYKIDRFFRKILRCDKGAPFDLDDL